MPNTSSTHLISLDSLIFTQSNIKKKVSDFSISPSNYLNIAFGLFMLSVPMIGWIEEKSTPISAILCIGGICEYIFGIYYFYYYKKIQNLFDIVFGLLHFLFFFSYDLGMFKIQIMVYHNYMKGVFYFFWLMMILIFLISLKDRGILYIINIFFIGLACVFVIIYEFSKKRFIKKIYGYIIFIICLIIWLIAITKIINEAAGRPFIPFIIPKMSPKI